MDMFRVWSIKTKEMIYIDDLYWFEENGIHDFNGSGHFDNYIIMKSTDLNDKKEKKLYDRDILYNRFVDDLWEVRWDAGKWVAGLIPNSGFIGHDCEYPQYAHTEDLIDVCCNFEKIGNFYENPEFVEVA